MAERLADVPSRRTWGWVVRGVLGVQLALLLALAQVSFAGYRLGVGNQSIQIPFLRYWADPALFANDAMVRQTLPYYPSFFYRGLAAAVGKGDLYSAYFWLHVATTAAVIAAAYALGRAMFRDRAAGAVLVLLTLAGHHRALAGDDLYSIGFTHTWAVFPLAIAAMALVYAGRWFLAFALVGVVFNLHALTAGYLFVMFGACALADWRRPGWWWRVALMVAAFAVIASPTLVDMVRHKQQFGAEWLERTRVRSADHSFPSSWWTAGATDVPRFVLLFGLAALGWSFVADRGVRRKSLAMAAGAGALFAAGWVFSDVWPVATVIRAQLFRCSRLVFVLMLAHVAYGVVRGWRMGAISWRRKRETRGLWRGSSGEPFPGDPAAHDPEPGRPGVAGRVFEVALATATFACVAIPGLIEVAPWVLVAGAVVAVANARLSAWQAGVVGAALLVTAVAWRTIEFHVPGIDSGVSFDRVRAGWTDAGRALWIAIAVAAAVWAAMRLPVGPRAKLCGATAVAFGCAALALVVYRAKAFAGASAADPWVVAQVWAEQRTPKNAVFLTPPQQGGFRIHSNRSVVCEWRDGTQLYFAAGYAKDWWERLTALRPSAYFESLTGDERSGGGGGGGELLRARALETMSDAEIVKLARQYGATHVVLPAGQTRELLERFTTADVGGAVAAAGGRNWTIYEPRILSAEEAFVEHVVLPNIERNRKSDVRVELTDAGGRTVSEGEYEVRQTRQAFGFGCSLPPFEPLDMWQPEWSAPPVTPKQLEAMKGVFNFSMIPFSGKWNVIEPEEGKRDYAELDKYVDWCVKNGIEMEFHYLSGFTPQWAARLGPAGLREAWMRHCRDVVERYQDRIKYWQVTNGRRLSEWGADVFKEMQPKYPHLKFGTSDCQMFYGGRGSFGEGSMYAGKPELEHLKALGVRVDFFATHGHKPNGIWPDMRVVYECLDEFAKLGVKIHVSEATVSLGLPIIGRPELEGERWTAEQQARFLETFYTTLFSHPAVEVINYWDLSHSVSRGIGRGGTGEAGLLDPTKNDEPRLAYLKLKELIRGKWMTRESGRLARDGTVAFRGFHGEYEVRVKTAGGKALVGRFTVKEGAENKLNLKLTEDAGGVASGR